MKTRVHSLFLLIIVLFSYTLSSQTTNAELPGWVLKTENYNRLNSAVGVSDPNPDSTKAFEQARLNALLNYSIFHDAVFTSLSNVGVGDLVDDSQHSTNIEYILYTGIIKGKLPSLSSCRLKEKYLTAYNEAIVLAEIDPYQENDSTILEYTVIRRAGFQKENHLFPLFIDEIEVEIFANDSLIMKYGIIKEGSVFKNHTNRAHSTFRFEFEDLRKLQKYHDAGAAFPDSQKWPLMPSPLNYGIWKAYLFNLVDQVSIYYSMDIDFQLKLSSANIGNVNESNQTLSFQQLVYSVKNVQSKKLRLNLSNMIISENCLYLEIDPGIEKKSPPYTLNPGKSEKKQLKKMLKENWTYFGANDFQTGWLELLSLKKQNDVYLNTEIAIQSSDLQSGIIEGIQLAKLYISSQLSTKINALTSAETGNENQLFVKSAKLIYVEKTGSIGPFYIFYQKTGPNLYQIRLILFYDLNQLK